MVNVPPTESGIDNFVNITAEVDSDQKPKPKPNIDRNNLHKLIYEARGNNFLSKVQRHIDSFLAYIYEVHRLVSM